MPACPHETRIVACGSSQRIDAMNHPLPTEEPTVSVIMPAYRAAATICRAIDSILAQSYPAHEILVIDDESPEDLEQVLRKYGDRVKLLRQPRGGVAAARNRGLDIATGDLVAFLDSDDEWLPGRLALGVDVLKKWPDVGLVVSGFVWVNCDTGAEGGTGGPPLDWCNRPVRVENSRLLQLAKSTHTGSITIRRSLLGQLRFDTTLTTAEDRDLWLRLLAIGTAYFVPDIQSRVFSRADSLSNRDIDVDCRCMLRVIDRYAGLLSASDYRRERSYVYLRWARGLPGRWRALAYWTRSVWLWPLPYGRGLVTYRMVRLRVLFSIIMRRGRRT